MRNVVIVLLCILFLSIAGCGTNDTKEVNPQNDTLIEVQDENQALEILRKEIDESADSADSQVSLLREVKLENEKIYAFERVGLKGGASSVYFVDSKGHVFYDSRDLLADYFKNSNEKEKYNDSSYLNTNLYYIEMESINDPEVITWGTYIVDGVGYPDIDSAIRGITENVISNDPILSLLGKDINFVENKTGQKAQKITVPDVHGMANVTINEIIYKGAKITFFGGNTATGVFFQSGQELLGIKIGDTFEEIMGVLGTPETLMPDPDFDDIYTMTYNFLDQLSVEFYAESENGNTVSASVNTL